MGPENAYTYSYTDHDSCLILPARVAHSEEKLPKCGFATLSAAIEKQRNLVLVFSYTKATSQ